MANRRLLCVERYTVGWVCALPVELAAATELLDEEHENIPQDPKDTNIYTLGRIGEHNVVLACLPAGQAGTNSAAAVAVELKSKFPSIRFGLMVGIGGGVPSDEADIRLGDVVVSQPHMGHGGVIQYDFGKTTLDGFIRTGFLSISPTILLNALAKLRANILRGRSRLSAYLATLSHLPQFSRNDAGPDLLFKPNYSHIGELTCDLCDRDGLVERTSRGSQEEVVVHYGTIASGNQVIKDGVTRDTLSSELGGVLCFEMEAAGLMNVFPCLVIRGICDYADSHKNKRWQAYAAATAAACAKEILSVIPAAEVALTYSVNEAPSRKVCWYVPFARNHRFVGRSSQLSELESKLFMEGYFQKVAITGLGGVGKTQIALELAYQTRSKRPGCSIFWVPATTAENVQQAYLEIGRQLQVPGIEDKEVDVKSLVQSYLSDENTGQWLLILDSMDDFDMWFKTMDIGSKQTRLIDYLPTSSKGSMVLTTRTRKVAVEIAHENVVPVPQMDEGIGIQILEKSLSNQTLLNDRRSVRQLLTQLTFLPLAIVQAAAYINKNDISFFDYLSLWDDTEENIIDMLSENFEDERRYQDSKNPIATTWLISFEQIRRCDPLAAEYLSFMSCVDPKMIPQSLLPPAERKKKMLDAIGTLTAYSFISRSSEGQSFDVHRLVHLATRNWLRVQDSLIGWTLKAVDRLAEVFPSHDSNNRTLWRAYLPHARLVLESCLIPRGAMGRLKLLEKSALSLYSDGRYTKAREQLVQLAEIKGDVLGKENPNTLYSVSWLAVVLRQEGRYEEAERLHRQALDGYEKVLGKEDLHTLESVYWLAVVLRDQGRYEEAEGLQRRALDGYEKLLGKENQSTLKSANELAVVLWRQGRYNEAERLHRRTLDGYEKVLGKEDQSTLASANDLALVLWGRGKYEEAEILQRRALEGYEKALGTGHPFTLKSVSNLAGVLWARGKYEEAEQMNRRALEGREKVLGNEHPDTLESVYCLAYLYHQCKRYDAASELYERACDGFKRTLGPNHPTTVACSNNLSEMVQDMAFNKWH